MLSFDVAELAHALQERGIASRVHHGLPRSAVEEADAPDLGLCDQRARRCERTESEDEVPARDHSITLSARSSTDCGIASPRALAVLLLIVSSNLVGCSIGRSPGFAPFRMRST